VDASDYAVGALVSQADDNGFERPISFASRKLNSTQRGWSTIEKESFAKQNIFKGLGNVDSLLILRNAALRKVK